MAETIGLVRSCRKNETRKTGQIKQALQMALTVATLQANEEIPGVGSHVHSQECFTKFVYKSIPEQCVPGLQFPMVETLLNAEPCRLWADFAQVGGDDNFENTAITAALGQQPGILNSKRTMEPLSATGMGKHATFYRSAKLPFNHTPATRDMKFTAE